MDSNGEIGLITIMDNKLIRFSKSLIKSEAILHREESLSVLGMLPTYLMKAFPLRKMSRGKDGFGTMSCNFSIFCFTRKTVMSALSKKCDTFLGWDSILLHIAY
ncbi:MAG: hypothetical protein Ct9H90mP13_00470 [Pseudomonadota bacterium]|nr:MAG: hypothetical protein Ct9H90mP13_00470 [Pseudomonadota bacterium]